MIDLTYLDQYDVGPRIPFVIETENHKLYYLNPKL